MLTVVDAETGRQLHVQTNSPSLRERYAAAATERDRRIRGLLAESGTEHLRLSTDRDWLLDVARFVGRRRRARVPIRPAFVRAGATAPATNSATPTAPATTPEGDR
jgi:hypothetical protein